MGPQVRTDASERYGGTKNREELKNRLFTSLTTYFSYIKPGKKSSHRCRSNEGTRLLPCKWAFINFFTVPSVNPQLSYVVIRGVMLTSFCDTKV